MCGICGVLNFDESKVSPALLKKMTDSIAHRGPDGEGWYQSKGLGFGHRRLAIVDLSPLGHQPMVTQDGRYALTYNGEIYNHREIRKELVSKGHFFRSQTDSEVVLHAWAEWGSGCVTKFNGMFAFAVWDSVQQELFLVRDRYGIKPMYFCRTSKHLVFASEIKAILQHPHVFAELDHEGLLEYLTFQNFLSTKTLLKGIFLVPSASISKIDTRSFEVETRRYWDFHFESPKQNVDEREWEEELDRLLKQAVSRQLTADVEIGSYLSGGMDSGTLVALASRELKNLKTFTCGFDLSSASGIELGFDEREKAEAMSAIFKTEHYERVLKSGDMEMCMQDLVWHLEEPRVGQSYPNYYAAKLASKFVKVVLSGTGGDELFAGYPWRYFRASGSQNFESFIDDYYKYWQRLVDNRHIKPMFSPISKHVEKVWTRNIFRNTFSPHHIELNGPEDYVNHSLYFEAKTFLQGLLLVEDKLSMAHGLETRVPFLDNDLVDFAMECPINLKIRNLGRVSRINENESEEAKKKFKMTSDGKDILRKVMAEYVPRSVIEGKKQGFSSPDASWFKGESIDFVKGRLLSKSTRIYDYLDRSTVEGLVNDHLEGKENRRLLIWSLLSVETFLDTFL